MPKTVFLTISEIKEEYGIDRRHIDKAIQEQTLTAYVFGKKAFKIKKSDLEKWIERHKFTPLDAIPLIRFKEMRR